MDSTTSDVLYVSCCIKQKLSNKVALSNRQSTPETIRTSSKIELRPRPRPNLSQHLYSSAVSTLDIACGGVRVFFQVHIQS
jgi:hypothetical protein